MKHKNSIRTKFFLAILALMLVLTLGMAAFMKFKVVPSLENLEAESAIQTTSKLEKVVTTSAKDILAVAADYGAWDDTRAVILDNTLIKKYFATNFIFASFENFNLNFVGLYDNKFKQIYGVEKVGEGLNNKFVFDLAKEYSNGVYTYYRNLDEKKQTITRFVLSEITDTQGDFKTKVGYLLLGQNLNIGALITNATDPQISVKLVNFNEVVQNNQPYYVQIKQQKIVAYFSMGYLNAKANYFFVEVTQGREFYLETLNNITVLMLGVYIIFILLMAHISYFLNKFIFQPLASINKETREVSLSNITLKNSNLPKTKKTPDEIGELRNSLSTMLEKIGEEEAGNKKIEAELKNNERQLLAKEKILSATAKLQQEVISKNEKKDIYEVLMKNILASLVPDRIQIFEDISDEISGEIHMQRFAQAGLKPSVPLYENDKFFENIPYTQEVFGGWLPALKEGKTLILNTENLAGEEKAVLEKYGIKTIILVPIFIKQALFGHLSVETFTKRTWREEELSLLAMAGTTLALALEKYFAMKALELSNFHDALTGLYNRKFYEEEAKRIFSTKRNYPISLIMGDLDGLKMTNDTLGHKRGDELIINVAKCLGKSFRKDEVVARVGGDEFSVVLPKCSEEEISRVYQRILEENKQMNEALEIPFNISLGYATQKQLGESFESVSKAADNRMYSNKMKNGQKSKDEMIAALLLTLTSKDATAEAHLTRAAEIIASFAKFLDRDEARIEALRLFAKFHDVGKAGIPEAILLKQGPLTPEEFGEMQRHSEIGYKLTKFVPYLAFASDWILHHHENWDGTGYPGKLAGEKIPFESRMMLLVGAYVTMISEDKASKGAKTKEEAIEEISKGKGTQFDPELAAAFIEFLRTSPPE